MSQMNSDTIEKTKQQIRGLVGEIQQLSKSDLSPDEFYAAFLQRVIGALAAVGGAVWVLGEGKKPLLAYQVNISPTLMDSESEDATKHSKLLEYIVNTNQPQLIPPLSSAGDERLGGNPTRQLMVVSPLGHDGSVEGLIEIFQRPDTQPATQRGYLNFLQQMSTIAAEWFKNRKLGQLTDKHSLWSDADQFSRSVHESLDLRDTCYTIVNEGRRLLGVDRVSVAIKKGGKCLVEAVSGQDTVDSRSNVMTMLGTLATRVAASGEPLWYMGSTEDMPPQIEEALEEYVDHSYTKSLTVLPLRKPRSVESGVANATGETVQQLGEIIGVLIVEQIESEIPRSVLDPRLDLVFEHSARALSNSIEHNTLFLMPVWKAIGHSQAMVHARNLPKTLTIGGGILAVLLALFIIPWDFNMTATGSLQPVTRADVFVPERTVVTDVKVDNNTLVEAGQELIILRSDELQQELKRVDGEMRAKIEQLNAIRQRLTDTSKPSTPQERARDAADLSSVEVEIKSLQDQLKLLRDREEKLIVRSPIKGRVITWDAKRQLMNRPVETGQVLLTVAAENSAWEVELYMPERRVHHLVKHRAENPGKEIPVDYILMTQPGESHNGTVEDVHWMAEPHEQEGHMVRVRIKTDPNDEKLKTARPGASVTAHVDCGDTVLGWALFHEAWEYAEANLLFW
ncbi:GAF domain-containing protein [Anatilimnocola sp. NA78]|uniref:GAF domain-containing protein n=1 Tax=Anatilimnocola sp. NA78 TaxID=3415683 RepID=UPI003CE47DEC